MVHPRLHGVRREAVVVRCLRLEGEGRPCRWWRRRMP